MHIEISSSGRYYEENIVTALRMIYSKCLKRNDVCSENKQY